MKKKLAVIMCAVMLISVAIVSITAAGDENTVTVGGVFKLTGEGLKEWDGDPDANPDYSYGYTHGNAAESNVLVIKSGKPMTISGKTENHRIVVDAADVDVNLTIKGLDIDFTKNVGATEVAFEIVKARSVTITLAEGSKNRLLSGTSGAGLQNNSATQNKIVPLTINGKGLLVAMGKGGGAGIGGGNNSRSGDITIDMDKGGVIIASGDEGSAGIGGGNGTGSADRSNGTGIHIAGGTVIASGGRILFDDNGNILTGLNVTSTQKDITGTIGFDANGNIIYYDTAGNVKNKIDEEKDKILTVVSNKGYGGAGIGGGAGGSGSDITISNSTVCAYGSNTNETGGAGIGGGAGGNGENIKIIDSTIIAYGYSTNNVVAGQNLGTGSAGIGGGSNGNGSGIEIKNSTVDAYGQKGGAGIGGGKGGSGSDITITGGNVTAITDIAHGSSGNLMENNGGKGGAGIGGGTGGDGSNINISGGANVKAWGGGNGAGIGGGDNGSGGDIEIDNSGGTIEVIGPSGGAGIGGGGGSNGSNIKIDSGTINATSKSSGAGIGGGSNGDGSEIEISGGNITAISSSGAGIGGGNGGDGSRIEISGGVIEKAQSSSGAGIGGGSGGDGSGIEISGGVIEKAQSSSGAGIGGGSGGNGSGIEISGGDITATSSSGAGIGGGQAKDEHVYIDGKWVTEYKGGNGENITINGGKIEANGSSGAGIGGGSNGNGTGITIGKEENSTIDITATSNSGAGIGGGMSYETSGNGEDITINGGHIEAKGVAGIGGGMSYGTGGNGKNIIINGGDIEAKGSSGGAGIGGQNVEGITISGGNVTATSEGNGTPPAAGIGGSYSFSNSNPSVTGITISGGNVTANGSASGGVGIGGGSTQTDITITGGTVRANVGGNAPGISGTDVYIGEEGTTTSTSYPWVYTNKINSTNDHSDSYQGIIFDDNYNQNYGSDATGKTGEVRQEYKPDGVIYGNVSLAELKEPYVLKSGETLNVHTGGTLTTGNKLTLEDGSVLYLEDGASIDTYKNIGGYQEEGNGSKILHECKAAPENPGVAETTCTICGSPVPHKWREEWEYNGTHHWHNCDSDDCSVLAEAAECSITDISQKNGYGEHKFGAPTYEYNMLTFVCEYCGYTYSVEKDKISIKKVGKDGESENPLAGAEFELYGISTDEETGEETQIKVGEATSALNEGETEAVAVFTVTGGINLGQTYYIKETKAPTDYAKSDIVYTIEIQAVGSDESDEIEVAVIYGTVDSDEIMTDIQTCINTKINIETIQIAKVDGETGNPLEGATFGLYSDAGCQTQVGTGNSGSDGTVSFEITGVNTTYYIKEITAPQGYTASEEIFKAVVDENGKVTYGDDGSDQIPECKNYAAEVVSDPVKIIKVDGETGNPLEGAQFGLYSDAGCQTQVGTGNSGSDGTVSFEITGVNTTYYIKEITAPQGYTASEEIFKAVVDENGKVTYGDDGSDQIPECKNYAAEVVSDPVKIIKVDGETGNPLEGAQFGLYSDASCQTLIGTGISGSDGTVSFEITGVNTTYYIKEITAPQGYTASEEVFKAVVDENGKVTYGDDGSVNIPVCENEKSTSPDEPVTPPDEPTPPPVEPTPPPDKPVTPPVEPTPPDEPVTPPVEPTPPDEPVTPPVEPTPPYEPTPPVVPYPPVVLYPPVISYPPVVPISPVVTPTVTETTEEEIIYDEPYYEDVSSAAGINADNECIDYFNSGKNCAAVIILIASFAVGFILRKKASK